MTSSPACFRSTVRWWLLVCALLVAGPETVTAESPLPQWQEGRDLYRDGRYEGAAQAFEEAVAEDPLRSSHHYWLGKAYGRLAERSGWFRALRLARKTREAFERALDLDPDNEDALEDLADFHAQAPAIVGGNPAQAEALRERLRALRARTERHDATR